MEYPFENPEKKVEILISVLKPLCESYRLLTGSAEELNRITLAHKKDLENAINRADDLGKIIDHVIHTLNSLSKDWLCEIKKHHCYDVSQGPTMKK